MAAGSDLMRRDWSAAPRVAARALAYAAAPTWVAMAMVSTLSTDLATPICASGDGFGALGGMAAMYALMAAFHLGPWLRLVGAEPAKTPRDQGEMR